MSYSKMFMVLLLVMLIYIIWLFNKSTSFNFSGKLGELSGRKCDWIILAGDSFAQANFINLKTLYSKSGFEEVIDPVTHEQENKKCSKSCGSLCDLKLSDGDSFFKMNDKKTSNDSCIIISYRFVDIQNEIESILDWEQPKLRSINCSKSSPSSRPHIFRNTPFMPNKVVLSHTISEISVDNQTRNSLKCEEHFIPEKKFFQILKKNNIEISWQIDFKVISKQNTTDDYFKLKMKCQRSTAQRYNISIIDTPVSNLYNIANKTNLNESSTSGMSKNSMYLASRECYWNPYIQNGIVSSKILDKACYNLISPISSSAKRYLFLGDSTVWRLWREGSNKCHADFRVSRCNWIEKFKLSRSKQWQLPKTGSDGPLAYGLQNHWCTDCSGCDSHITEKNTKSCIIQNYVSVEYAKDVEMQSHLGNTTQESLAQYLSRNSKYNVCIVNSGIHDMGIRNITDKTFVRNVKWYIDLVLPNCEHLFWIDMAAPVSDKYAQTDTRQYRWNEMVASMLTNSFDNRVSVVHVFEPSIRAKHFDYVHMDRSWYMYLNKLFFHKHS